MYLLILLLWVLMPMMSFAYGEFELCAQVHSFKDFYKCSIEKHPKFRISQLKAEEGAAAVEKASQWENPELSIKSLGGDKAGEKMGETELEATVSVSQLWLRSSRQDIAEAEKKLTQVESQEMRLELQKQMIRDLYRMRQLMGELELVSETLETFSSIRKQYQSKFVRGPEQEITLSLVELASSDYELKKNHLMLEKAEIDSRLKAMWGDSFEVKNEFLPSVKTKWPELNLAKSMNHSFETQKFKLENEKAIAEKQLAQKESWPTFAVGGVINRTTEGPTQYMNYGVLAKLSLPLFSLNGGARRLAETKAVQTQLLSDWALKKSDNDKEILLQKYRSSVESLQKISNSEQVQKRHKKIDLLFKQGLASGGLIIELHRQIIEYTESQNEHENSAIESFLEVKTINGENFEEIL